jgi:hemolysin III
MVTAPARRAPSPARTRPYSPTEELANVITHGAGTAAAVVGLVLLVVAATRHGDPWQLASAVVYGVSMVLLYGASTAYHAVLAPRAKHVLKVVDHASIYLLIAGTYTPFSLITLRAHGGWWLFGVIWGLALAGISVEAFWVHRPKWLSALVYVAMGWIAIVMIRPLVAGLPRAGAVLLVAGGIAYTLGTVFYVQRRRRFTHAVWHLFVIAGTTCHFLAVLLHVFTPRP